jgi:hypothetical protein
LLYVLFLIYITEVYEWMKEAEIERPLALFEEHKFNGKALAELKRLHSHHPLFQIVCEQFGIAKCGEMLQLSAAVNKLH